MRRVLVVDDSVTQAKKLAWILQNAGHEVEVMIESVGVLERLRAGHFDIVMSDVVMPDIDGYQLCRAIKNDPALRHIPVILLTALSEISDILEGLSAGADNFITKPYEPESLLARMERILSHTQDDEPAGEHEPHVSFRNKTYRVDASRQQMLTFLISTFEDYEYSKLCEREALRNAMESKRRTTTQLAHKERLLAQVSRRLNEHQKRTRQLTEARERAAAESLAKSRLLATISHELRTPLNGMIGASQLIATTRSQSERTEYAAILLRSGQALTRLVDDILELARYDTGVNEPRREAFNIRELIADLSALFRFQASAKGLELSHEVAEEIPQEIVGDAQAVRRLLINLVDNAVKFTSRGYVKITCSLVEKHPSSLTIRFQIMDTGPGIPQHKLDQIFEPFGQSDLSTTREFSGLGLGLSISKRLAESLCSRIHVESTPGRGSTFSCDIWFAHQTHEHSEPPEQAAPSATSDTPGPEPEVDHHAQDRDQAHACVRDRDEDAHRILLVDDNPINRKVGSRLLEKLGFECDVVNDGRQAVEAVRLLDYSLVLMDCLMPVMDGYDATSAIRRNEDHTHIPIVALTAALSPEDQQRCLDVGMDAVLGKPIDIQALQRVLDQHLRH